MSLIRIRVCSCILVSLITKAVEAKGPGLLGSEGKWSYPTVDFSGQLHFSEVSGAEKKIMN